VEKPVDNVENSRLSTVFHPVSTGWPLDASNFFACFFQHSPVTVAVLRKQAQKQTSFIFLPKMFGLL
jgi:hypothetical protein